LNSFVRPRASRMVSLAMAVRTSACHSHRARVSRCQARIIPIDTPIGK
jgi:hypothetical protein